MYNPYMLQKIINLTLQGKSHKFKVLGSFQNNYFIEALSSYVVHRI